MGFKAVIEALKDHQRLRVSWGDYYREDLIPSRLLQGPYVFDPANPTNNLYADVDSWGEVREVAEDTLRKPLLCDVQVTDNWSNVNFSDDIRESSSLDLNKFISDELQPNEDFHRLFNDATDSLYRELQRDLQNTNYRIHNLIQGGSIANGTALKNDAGLDCVMVMKGITKASELRSKLPDILRDLESRLRNWKGDPWQLTTTKRTHFSVQFNMSRLSTESIKVDLFPTFEANVVDINGTYVTARVARPCNVAFTPSRVTRS
ncbi:2 5 oligoadenylate synthetase [Porites harrisoni]